MSMYEYFSNIERTDLDECFSILYKKFGELSKEEINDIVLDYVKENLHAERMHIFGEFKSKKYDKQIYIFGENYEYGGGCKIKTEPSILIYNLFDKILKDNPEKTIDIFVGIDYISKDQPQRSDISKGYADFYELEKRFHDCLMMEKSGCQYPNLRMHYSELSHMKSYPLFYNLSLFFSKYKEYSFQTSREVEEVRGLFMDLTNDFGMRINMNEFLERTKIGKQLKNISEEEIKDDISLWIRNTITSLNSNIMELNSLFQKTNPDLEFLTFLFSKSARQCLKLGDMYVISRIFREFSNGQEPTHIITFHSHEHSRKIALYLKRLKFIGGIKVSTGCSLIPFNFFSEYS